MVGGSVGGKTAMERILEGLMEMLPVKKNPESE